MSILDPDTRIDGHPRQRMRRAYVVLPSGLTLANLFCGVFAIVSASRGQFDFAGLLVLLGVVLALAIDPRWIFLSGFVGLGLTFAGLSDICLMGILLSRLPWNRASQCSLEPL